MSAEVTLSDADGKFDLGPETPTMDGSWLWAAAEGHKLGGQALATSGETPGTVIKLDRGEAIEGIVLDELGIPVAGARVTANLEENRAGWPLHPSRLYSGRDPGNFAVTNALGQFVVAGLDSASEYELRVMLDGWEQAYERFPPMVRAGARGIGLHVIPTVALEVHVVSRDERSPLGPHRLEAFHTPGLQLTGSALNFGEPADQPSGGGIASFRYRVNRTQVQAQQQPGVRVQVFSPGHQPFAEHVVLELGKSTVYVAALSPTQDGVSKSVAVRAHYKGGRAFTGRLSVLVGGRGMLVSEQVFDVEAGRATDGLVLPPGEYTVRPGGWGDAGQWWTVAGASTKLLIEEQGLPSVLALELAGAPVAVTVRTQAGTRVRGYDLVLKSNDASVGDYSPYWDLGLRAGEQSVPDSSTSAESWLWLPPGPHVLTANVPGYGKGSAAVLVQEDGTTAVAPITVLRGPWLDLRKRRALSPPAR